MIENIIYSFIPLFVAIDSIGIIPMFLSLTNEYDYKGKKKIALDSVLTACAIGIIFVFAGKFIFKVLGITVADFAIAGGLLLFSFSILDLLRDRKPVISKNQLSSLGIFPLGTPLIAGPAVLTTLIIIVDTYGFISTLIAFGLNLIFLVIALIKASTILSFLGEGGTRALAKIMSILLAAIGIMMVRKGIIEIISGNL